MRMFESIAGEEPEAIKPVLDWVFDWVVVKNTDNPILINSLVRILKDMSMIYKDDIDSAFERFENSHEDPMQQRVIKEIRLADSINRSEVRDPEYTPVVRLGRLVAGEPSEKFRSESRTPATYAVTNDFLTTMVPLKSSEGANYANKRLVELQNEFGTLPRRDFDKNLEKIQQDFEDMLLAYNHWLPEESHVLGIFQNSFGISAFKMFSEKISENKKIRDAILQILQNLNLNKDWDEFDEFQGELDKYQISYSQYNPVTVWTDESIDLRAKVLVSLQAICEKSGSVYKGGANDLLKFLIEFIQSSPEIRESVLEIMGNHYSSYRRLIEWRLRSEYPEAWGFRIYRGLTKKNLYGDDSGIKLPEPAFFTSSYDYASEFLGEEGEVLVVDVPIENIAASEDTNYLEIIVEEGNYSVVRSEVRKYDYEIKPSQPRRLRMVPENTVFQFVKASGRVRADGSKINIPTLRIFEIFGISLTSDEQKEVIAKISSEEAPRTLLLRKDILLKPDKITLDESMGIVPQKLLGKEIEIGDNALALFKIQNDIDFPKEGEIRMSPSSLFQIPFDPSITGFGAPLYLVTLNKNRIMSGRLVATPVGGGYKFLGEKGKNVYRNAMLNPMTDASGPLEMRQIINIWDVEKFIDLFVDGTGRETSPVRELIEEIIGPESEENLLSQLPESAIYRSELHRAEDGTVHSTLPISHFGGVELVNLFGSLRINPGEVVRLAEFLSIREYLQDRVGGYMPKLTVGFDTRIDETLKVITVPDDILTSSFRERFLAIWDGVPGAGEILENLRIIVRDGMMPQAFAEESSSVEIAEIPDAVKMFLRNPKLMKSAFKEALGKDLDIAQSFVIDIKLLEDLGLMGAEEWSNEEMKSNKLFRFLNGLTGIGKVAVSYDLELNHAAVASKLIRMIPLIKPIPYSTWKLITGKRVNEIVFGPGYVALFPIESEGYFELKENSNLRKNGMFVAHGFLRALKDKGISLDVVRTVAKLAMLKEFLEEDAGKSLKVLTPQAFNATIQFIMNTLMQTNVAREAISRAA